MTLPRLPLFSVSLALLFSASFANASLFVSEYFDYTNYGESMNGANGGTGWNGAWQATDVNGSLTVADVTIPTPENYLKPSLPASAKLTPANDKNKDAYRNLAAPISLAPATNTTYYFSYLWMRVDNPSAAGESSFFSLRSSAGAALLNFGVDGTEKLFIKAEQAASGITGGVSAQGTETLKVTTNINTTGKYLIVGKIELNADGSNVLSLSAYERDGMITGEPSVWDVALSVDSLVGDISRVYLYTQAYAQDSYFDNILMGTTFSDVTGYNIPEPSVAGLLFGLGALGLVCVRHRRK